MDNVTKIIIESIPQNNPDIFTILAGLLTPLIALIAIYIAWKQFKIEHFRLKNDLYDKRLEVYTALDQFLLNHMQKGYSTYEQIAKFNFEISKSKFLFKKDVQDYLNEIRNKTLKIYELQIKLYPENNKPGLPIGEERTQISTKQAELNKWMIKQFQNSINIFKNYFEFNY